jgi:hydrogenase maturation factor
VITCPQHFFNHISLIENEVTVTDYLNSCTELYLIKRSCIFIFTADNLGMDLLDEHALKAVIFSGSKYLLSGDIFPHGITILMPHFDQEIDKNISFDAKEKQYI